MSLVCKIDEKLFVWFGDIQCMAQAKSKYSVNNYITYLTFVD